MTLALIDAVREYYYQNFDKLSPSKQFHFASRLAPWTGDQRAIKALEHTRSYLLEHDTEENRRAVLNSLLHRQQTGRRNAHELRLPFFKKYPSLYGLDLAVFRVRHLKSLYGLDLRPSLFTLYPLRDIMSLREELLADEQALKYLSTFAINFCYLTDIILNEKPLDFNVEHFYQIGLSYDVDNKSEIQLMLYLCTHCIIAESNFYLSSVSEKNLSFYIKMLEYSEEIIAKKFTDISIDNKLEFLVAARICNYRSGLEDRIYTECEKSISNDGTFIVDRHNNSIRPERHTFEKSEHRNVLLIMSGSRFVAH